MCLVRGEVIVFKKFDIVEKIIVPSDRNNNLIDLYINPDEKEKEVILKDLHFDEHTLLSALDADEIPRVEFEDEYTFIVWKRPKNHSAEEAFQYGVSSIGMILTNEKLVVILEDNYELYNKREFSNVNSLFDYVLKIFFYTVRHYVDHIKQIKLVTKELADKLSNSIDNRYFIKMFNLSESLVYYIDAITANNTVLRRLKNNVQKLGITPDELETLEDLIIENNQCLKQAEIYSTILSGLMDARGNLINNNVNVLMRKLTIISCIFLPLGVIASMGGMSEYTAILAEYGVGWGVGYLVFLLSMIPIAWISYQVLRKLVFKEDFYSKSKKR